jgi:L-threonylcarbamoyladenylate synthase
MRHAQPARSRPTCPLTTDIGRAATALRDGQLVAFATETVYGLGANALDENAVARVFEVKDRPHFDPLIVHVASEEWLSQLVHDVPETARQLAHEFWPGPLTMVLPKTDLVPDLVTSGLSSVAVRMPSHPQARELLRQVDLPIAAPSANPFGQLSPTSAAHVTETLGGRIDLILDGGPCDVGVESTVILLTEEQPCLLRHGGVTQEQIEAVIGPIQTRLSSSGESAPSPGMLSQHYAPRTPLILNMEADAERLTDLRVGVLSLQAVDTPFEPIAVETLTDNGDLRTATAGFFAAMRRLDQASLDLIVAWPFPDEGLGRALNDRLSRACHVERLTS